MSPVVSFGTGPQRSLASQAPAAPSTRISAKTGNAVCHRMPPYTEDCVGKYEYMPDGSWKGSGTCTVNQKGGIYENLTDTLSGGTYKGPIQLP